MSNKIWTPNSKKEEKKPENTAEFFIEFSWADDEKFDVVVDRLDQKINDERTKAVKALAKYFKVVVKFDEGALLV